MAIMKWLIVRPTLNLAFHSTIFCVIESLIAIQCKDNCITVNPLLLELNMPEALSTQCFLFHDFLRYPLTFRKFSNGGILSATVR